MSLSELDPLYEGRTTFRGELQDEHERHSSHEYTPNRTSERESSLSVLPSGVAASFETSVLNDINKTLANMESALVLEVLAQMKVAVYLSHN